VAGGCRIGSIAASSRSASERKLSCRTLSALRRANPTKLSGSSWRPGIIAPSTRIGITRMSRSNAAVISRRTMSSGSSSRRCPSLSVALSQVGPMTASSTSQVLTAWEMTSAKSSPGAMVSTSMKT
jgi:hypothetical protein